MLFELIQLVNGPIFKIVDKLIPDPNLRLKLKAEIEQAAKAAQADLVKAQKDVILAEFQTDSFLTRMWRPCLMFLAMFILALYGIILPSINLLLDTPVAFVPLWNDVPAGIWELLKWGVGGYIGGRSLEKIATGTMLNEQKEKTRPTFLRRFIGKREM